jgi:hypothetical protein
MRRDDERFSIRSNDMMELGQLQIALGGIDFPAAWLLAQNGSTNMNQHGALAALCIPSCALQHRLLFFRRYALSIPFRITTTPHATGHKLTLYEAKSIYQGPPINFDFHAGAVRVLSQLPVLESGRRAAHLALCSPTGSIEARRTIRRRGAVVGCSVWSVSWNWGKVELWMGQGIHVKIMRYG